jgi:hypothetical protein
LADCRRHTARCEEFYTWEKPGKPMFRAKEIKIISLFTLLPGL